MIKRLGFWIFLILFFFLVVFVGMNVDQGKVESDVNPSGLVSPNTGMVKGVSELSDTPLSIQTSINFVAGGDVMFDRYIRQVAKDKGYRYALEGLNDLLKSSDFVLANLEGPVTDFPSISMYSEFGTHDNYIFTFDPEVIEILKEYKFLVSLGNNHVLNFGQAGLDQTLENLERGGVSYFGQTGRETIKNHFVYKKNDLKIGFINYNQFINDDKQEVLETIVALKGKVDFVAIYTHWGNEYVVRAGNVIQDLAHEFIDQGADLVIGSHPHVVQQVEEYRNKKIYYSLGNFVFDQYFSEETMKGLLVKVSLRKKNGQELELIYTEIPIELLPSGQSLVGE